MKWSTYLAGLIQTHLREGIVLVSQERWTFGMEASEKRKETEPAGIEPSRLKAAGGNGMLLLL